jgi:hypothetical protein
MANNTTLFDAIRATTYAMYDVCKYAIKMKLSW